MRSTIIGLALACFLTGCAREPAPAGAGSEPAAVTTPYSVVQEEPSPDGRASLVYYEGPNQEDSVVLVVRGDTSGVLFCDFCKTVGLEWLSNDLGKVHLPIGGNYYHSGIYVEPSSGRVSPTLDTPVAVDAAARTVITYDIFSFTLRDLWSGRELASWVPADPDAKEMWQQCDATVTLRGREGRIRYDCRKGVVERRIDW